MIYELRTACQKLLSFLWYLAMVLFKRTLPPYGPSLCSGFRRPSAPTGGLTSFALLRLSQAFGAAPRTRREGTVFTTPSSTYHCKEKTALCESKRLALLSPPLKSFIALRYSLRWDSSGLILFLWRKTSVFTKAHQLTAIYDACISVLVAWHRCNKQYCFRVRCIVSMENDIRFRLFHCLVLIVVWLVHQ